MKDMVGVNKSRKLVLILVTLFFSHFFLGSLDVKAEGSNENLVNIYFIYSNTCSHCHSEEKLLEEIEKKYSNIKIYRYEVHEEETKEVLEQLEEIYSLQSSGVPITVIGNKVYTGYSEEKSKLKFIKTIEYFSRYGYRDELGEALKVEKLPEYHESEIIPTLEDFLDTYGNIRLFGEIYTDDLDVSLTAILLGFLSGMNGIFFVMTLLIVIILKKVENRKDKILLLGFHFIVFFSVFMTYVFPKKEFVITVAGLWFLLFWGGIWKYGWNKRIKSQKERNQNQNKTLLFRSLFIILAVGANYAGNYFFRKYVVMLKEILNLHQLLGVERIIYYLNYFFTVIIVLVFLTLLVWQILNKIYIRKAKSSHL